MESSEESTATVDEGLNSRIDRDEDGFDYILGEHYVKQWEDNWLSLSLTPELS
jgi:hypothetical protein